MDKIPEGVAGSANGSNLDEHQKAILRMALVNSSRKLLGIPYSFGAEWSDLSLPPESLDCSEMIEGIYHQNGIRCPDGSQNQFDFFVPTGAPKPGDLGFFGRGQKVTQIYHVGMILDEFNLIEARGFDPRASFKTGEVIIRAKTHWENWKDFVGYRAHPKLL